MLKLANNYISTPMPKPALSAFIFDRTLYYNWS